MDTAVYDELEAFRVKCANHLARTVKIQSIWDDAIRHGVTPDYDSHTVHGGSWNNVAVHDYVENGSPLNVEATQKRFATIVQWAKKRGYGIEKKYTDDEFQISVKIDEDTTFNFYSTRQVVCTKVVKGIKVVPAQPEKEVEDIEWVCDKVAFLKVEV